MLYCPVCEFESEKRASMSAHFRKHPLLDTTTYWKRNTERQKCACGCGEYTLIHRGKPNKFVLGHNFKGDVNPNIGKKYSEERIEKIRKSQIGKKVSKSTRKKLSEAQDRIWTEKRKQDARERVTGEKHPNWKGGRTKELKSRRTNAPAKTVLAVRERDGNECQMCGMTKEENGRNMDVHHIEPFLDSRNNDMSNLISLCRSCHITADRNNYTLKEIREYINL